MNIIDKYRKELIVLGVIIELILVPLIVRNMKILKNKEKQDENIIPVMNEIGKREFGIMYRDSLNSSYVAYNGSISDALSSGYALNVLNSRCQDGSGNGVNVQNTLSINGNIITVKSNKTIYCTLNFDKLVRATDLVTKAYGLSTTEIGGMYRFQGTNPLNYICFGTYDAVECINDPEHYMYRIIGVNSDNLFKIIKLYGVTDGGYDSFPWDTSTALVTGSGVNQKLNSAAGADWNNADLFKRLNGMSNGTNVASNTDLFIDNPEYSYLKSGDKVNGGTEPSNWFMAIEKTNWKWGRTNTTDFDADTLYSIESGQTAASYTYLYSSGGSLSSINYSPMAGLNMFNEGTRTFAWNTTIESQISLLYLHDLAYSLSISGSTLADFSDSWLYYNADYFTGSSIDTSYTGEWYSTGYGVSSSGLTMNKEYRASSRAIANTSALGTTKLTALYAPNSTFLGVRPVFYLRQLPVYGTGVPSDPFMIPSP